MGLQGQDQHSLSPRLMRNIHVELLAEFGTPDWPSMLTIRRISYELLDQHVGSWRCLLEPQPGSPRRTGLGIVQRQVFDLLIDTARAYGSIAVFQQWGPWSCP